MINYFCICQVVGVFVLASAVSRHSQYHINYFVTLTRFAALCMLHTNNLLSHLKDFFKDSMTAAAVNDRFHALTVP